jgi:hypothetical protein
VPVSASDNICIEKVNLVAGELVNYFDVFVNVFMTEDLSLGAGRPRVGSYVIPNLYRSGVMTCHIYPYNWNTFSDVKALIDSGTFFWIKRLF